MPRSYPPELAIEPVTQSIRAEVRVPGSKSYSNRALPVAAVAAGTSVLTGLLVSQDTEVMADSLRRLGVSINGFPQADEDASAEGAGTSSITVQGVGGAFPASAAELFFENSGTSIRFLTAMLAAGKGRYVLDGSSRMRERPIGDLAVALRAWRASIEWQGTVGCPPFVLEADGLATSPTTPSRLVVAGDVSSQFLSGLLMAAPLLGRELEITVDGDLVSKPYVDMTLEVMHSFGVHVDRDGFRTFRYDGGQRYGACRYAVEPDASAASYFAAAAAITGGDVTLTGLGTACRQGDLQFVRVLERMGCRVMMTADATTVEGGRLRGVDADLCHFSDTAPTLAAVACFAEGPTRIRNVANIRVKETDRIAAVVAELRRAGLRVEEFDDGLEIHPGSLQPTRFKTYDDHRMAMSLSLLGLRQPGVVVLDPGCVAKTYPRYFDDLDAACGRGG